MTTVCETPDLPDKTTDLKRRRLLLATVATLGSAGTIAVTVPFVRSLMPSERAKSVGMSIKVDISKLEPGQQITVEWRGKPIWILRRTPDMLERMKAAEHLQQLRDPDSEVLSQQPSYAKNSVRSINSEYLIVVGLCTHLGCVPTFRPEIAPEDLGPKWVGGYFCPCHGSRFDFAGRVYQGVPAPINLLVPPHHYVSDTLVDIGSDNVT